MISESEVRQMLENYRTDSANLEWWFEHKGVETDAEFYEGEQSGAVDYAKDKIQSSGEIDGGAVGLICKRARKIEQDEPDELIEKMYADKLRLHRLDCAVYESLKGDPMAMLIIRKRYLEGMTILQIQIEANKNRKSNDSVNYSYCGIKKATNRAIRKIAEAII